MIRRASLLILVGITSAPLYAQGQSGVEWQLSSEGVAQISELLPADNQFT
ncbi:hypothetical protein [Vibrio sp. SCSIO 43137]|nr:hypothetical protein [Vibrio sp. SCSIO 43137]WCE31871.1 hypothetical protein PK654_22360 [Vibrio sp. SCSIO 43137]